MTLVKCPECAGSVSSQAPVCPHCGYPRPGAATAPAAESGPPPPSRGISPGLLIFGIVTVGMVVLGLIGLGVYRVVQRGEERVDSRQEELVDYVDPVDSVATGGPTPPPDGSTYELSAVETLPELLNRDEIAASISRSYPPSLREAGVTGSVMLRFRIGEDGLVDPARIEVMQSSHDEFSRAATSVAARLRFRPARADGKPVPVWATLPVTFKLEP